MLAPNPGFGMFSITEGDSAISLFLDTIGWFGSIFSQWYVMQLALLGLGIFLALRLLRKVGAF